MPDVVPAVPPVPGRADPEEPLLFDVDAEDWLSRLQDGDLTFSAPRYLEALLRAADSKALNKIESERILNDTLPLPERAEHLRTLIARGEAADLILAFRPEFLAAVLPAIVTMTREGSIDRNHPDDIEASLTSLLSGLSKPY